LIHRALGENVIEPHQARRQPLLEEYCAAVSRISRLALMPRRSTGSRSALAASQIAPEAA
jgi:hypothetical protein